MATKDITLKKRLIKNGIVGGVAIASLFAGAMLLSDYDDNAQSEKRIKENENSAILSEHNAIQQELGTGFEVSAFYNAYSKYRNSNLLLKRDEATQLMSAMRERNHLTNLSVVISPITDVTADFGQIKSGVVVKSEVKLSFGAVTDNSAYGLIEELEHKLPGIVVIQDIKLTRTAEPPRNLMTDLSQHKLAALVNGDVTFLWLGIRPNEDKAASPGSPLKGANHAP